jgi:TPR repeat protein
MRCEILSHELCQRGSSECPLKCWRFCEGGIGVAKDQLTASRLLKKAANQRDKQSLTFLAIKYSNGLGVAKDKVSAYAWPNMGAAFGDKDDHTGKGEQVERESILPTAGVS